MDSINSMIIDKNLKIGPPKIKFSNLRKFVTYEIPKSKIL